MKKLLTLLDNNILKWCIIFASLFIVLYPKLPSIHIVHTWVYIRLEDFVISGVVILWIVQVLRKKARIPFGLGTPIALYWLAGAASLIFSLLYIGPHLINFFPTLAILEYLRRIEYMILFFVGFGAINSKDDFKQFVKFLFLGVGAVVLYGLAQHFYPYFWKYLPTFIQKTNYCFPSFQTGNEEFAKGIPLCLPVGSRVTSTFGGHYDLAGYLIITLPIILSIFFLLKKKASKVMLGTLFITGLITLILTSSRIAFGAYLFAVVTPLFALKKKKFILPLIILSLLCLVLFSESTIRRFAQTFRLTTVVLNAQGQVVGTTESGLSADQQKQLKNGKNAVQANIASQNLPVGSSFITLPQKTQTTNTAIVQKKLSAKEAARLKLENGGLELSAVKGNFSVQKALVYDISVTTRLQAEWPNAVTAFLRNIFLGSGYSTATLAVDNDYLRFLAESGLIGLISFFAIFVIFGIFLEQVFPLVENPLAKSFALGLVGGFVGLLVNATLFDIFEASKVAEPLWLLMGVAAGALSLYQKKRINYLFALWKILTKNFFLYCYLCGFVFAGFSNSIGQFFIGDDFVWLKWAATSSLGDIRNYFLAANDFFYRPLDKTLMLFLYSFFAFNPGGYHVVILLLHAAMSTGVYTLSRQIFKKKHVAFLSAVLFLFLPVHAENIFWISGLSIDLGSVLLLFGITSYMKSRQKHFVVWYVISIILSFLALLAYELAVVMPVLILTTSLFVYSRKKIRTPLLLCIPFVILDIFYFCVRILVHAFGGSGDYSYSIPHLLPNIVGNVFGYFGLFVFGEGFLQKYDALRTMTKSAAIPVAGVLLVALLVFAWWLWRKKPWKYFRIQNNAIVFGLSLSVGALLPYLALGNIAERYGYLASVGFVICITGVVHMLLQKLKTVYRVTRGIGIATCIVLVGWWFISCNTIAMQEWQIASKITYNALGYFKIEQEKPQPNSTFIIVNLPIRRANAWIFPTGFPEGLWFLYRDKEPKIVFASTSVQAKQLQVSMTTSGFVFIFDKEYSVAQVK